METKERTSRFCILSPVRTRPEIPQPLCRENFRFQEENSGHERDRRQIRVRSRQSCVETTISDAVAPGPKRAETPANGDRGCRLGKDSWRMQGTDLLPYNTGCRRKRIHRVARKLRAD